MDDNRRSDQSTTGKIERMDEGNFKHEERRNVGVMGVLETREELLIVQKLELSIEHPASGATDYELRITN